MGDKPARDTHLDAVPGCNNYGGVAILDAPTIGPFPSVSSTNILACASKVSLLSGEGLLRVATAVQKKVSGAHD